MATITELEFSLVANLTASGTWVQLAKVGGSAYVVPTDGETKVRWFKAINNGADSAVVQFALSTDGTITDDELASQPVTLPAGYREEQESGESLPVGYGVWARATGTSPNVTVRAFAFETVTT